MTTSQRYMTSLLMTTIYLLIVFTPLAPLAMQSKIIVHAVTGECSGDCRVDGCSLERSAARTCCCWQKNKRGSDDVHLQHTNADVCNLPSSPPDEASEMKADCCDAPARNPHNKSDAAKSVSTPAPQKAKPVTIGCTPCGNSKLFTLSSTETTQHLPFYFSGEFPSPEQSHLSVIIPKRLTSRYADPPDPPPIISSAS